MAEDAARELPNLSLEDALQLVKLYAERGSPKYEKAAIRWLERYLTEGSPTPPRGLSRPPPLSVDGEPGARLRCDCHKWPDGGSRMNVALRRRRCGMPSLLLAFPASFALVFTGCGGAGGGVETNELPLKQDFSECGAFTMNDEVATIDCPAGELRVLVEQPDVSPTHFVPFRADANQQTLAVSAEARAQKAAGGAWGVGCIASEPDEGGRGYLLLVSDEGAAALLRLDVESQEGDRYAQRFTPLSQQENAIRGTRARHTLQIRCAKEDAGTARVRAGIDGGRALTADDTQGMGPFTGAMLLVLAERPDTDIRFDKLTVDGAPVIERGSALGDQKERIALVRAAAAKRTANGRVTSVFCQSENSGCVVTYVVEYAAPDCQFWFVANVGGAAVAEPDGPLSEGHGTYDEDNPDAIGCDHGP
jgi:hypothetical protein